jgi:PAS domain S-box-containing protein
MVVTRIRTFASDGRMSANLRLRIAVSSVVFYLLLCYILRIFSQFTSMPILSVLPVMVIAWLYGARAGIIAGLVCFPFNALLLTIIGIDWVENMLRTGGGLVGGISLVGIGFIVGRLSDVSQRLGAELRAREAVEEELRLHRENLEQLVNDKVRNLHESRERFRAIAENSPDAILITDVFGVIQYCNRGTERLFGYAQDALVGRNSVMFLPEHMREEEQFRRDSMARSGMHAAITATVESEMVCRDGTHVPVEFSLYSWSLEGDLFYSLVIRDITERRQAEASMLAAAEALQRSRDFFQNVFNVVGDGIYVTDEMGNIVFANSAMCDMLGYEHSEMIGSYAVDFAADMLLAPVNDAMEQEMYARDYSAPFETSYIRKDGSRVPVESRIANVPDDGRIGAGIVVTLRDITERKQAQEEIRQARDFLATMFKASPDAIIVVDKDGIITAVNDSVFDVYGYRSDELIGKHITLIPSIDDQSRERHIKLVEQLNTYGIVRNFEETRAHKDGHRIQVETSIAQLQNSDGTPAGAVSSTRDITERKQAQEEIRQARDSLATLFKTSPDAVIVADADGYITAANDSVFDVYGYRPEELIGQHVSMMPDNDDSLRENINLVEHVYENGIVRGFEITRKHKDGHSIQVETSVALLKNSDGTPAGAISSTRDITERKHLEDQLQRSRDYLETLFMASPDAIVVCDNTGTIIMANDSVVDVYGYRPEELIGEHGAIFTPHNDKLVEGTMEALEELFEQGVLRNVLSERQHKDGHIFQAESSHVLLKDPDGSLVGSVSATRDITDRMRLQEQLRQAQKMEAIGTLAGGIAHDFNNILGAIIGYSELSQHDSECAPTIRNNLDQILNAAERARNLVKQILTFSRKSQSEVKPLQMHVILKEALKLMRASIPANIEIKADVAERHDVVLADATQIHQIIVNLCTNAAHAMEQSGGVLTIDLQPIELQDADIASYSGLQPGLYVELRIRDIGTGIALQELSRIFEPFFTTKEVGRGTGMGLAVVHGIVKSLKGDIKVYSKPGRGTVFHVLLPRLDEDVAGGDVVVHDPPRGHEKVLLVDDEPALLDVGASMLRSLGYQVTAVQKPREALELFARDPEAFDLIFTDQAMPGLTGFDFGQQALKLRPDIPVVLCTGYSDLVTEKAALAAGIRAFVIKPLSRQLIGSTIRRVLDGGASD